VSTRARLTLAAAVALVAAVGIGIVVAGWLEGDARAAAPLGLEERAAVALFSGYREARAALGRRCVRVVVADTAARREQGLRGASDLGPYTGMLFAMASDSNVAFTMSGVSAPLDITWYSAAGSRVGGARMRPCPRLAAARCAVYRSRVRYRFALEVPAGRAAPTQLTRCSV
jgi:uncharacterized membrane protein (UPF0127 family)